MLRRISQALRRQDWTMIAVQFVLLVAGVFLGEVTAGMDALSMEQP